jgi:HD-GYP domain-containing protein (c-di-GMP phosphodiesterase class II)
LIQVPVVHRGACFGWLLALNRIPWSERSTQPIDSVPIAFSDNEFGTGEVGLMSSAASVLAAHYRNTELFREKEVLLIGVVRALINAIDAKDSYTCGHSDRVAVFAKCIGEQMGLSIRDCEQLYMSGLLHDLGKIGIPDQVLCKPGKLTDEEFAIIRQHPTIGHSILNHLPQLQHILPGVLHHHESVNGRGYPHGLAEEEIPLFGRILAVADSFDAMTSARPYRSAMSTEKATAILREGAGTQWDRQIVEAFLEALPAIEEAGEQSDAHLEQVLRTSSDGQASSSETDTIARAVNALQV